MPITLIELDKTEQGAEAHKELKEISGHKTVPTVYINRTFVGGCNQVKEAQQNGMKGLGASGSLMRVLLIN